MFDRKQNQRNIFNELYESMNEWLVISSQALSNILFDRRHFYT